jgi:hypothetical protein
MQRTRQYLSNDIQVMKNKISILDATAFSSEQECKRTEQQLQELGDKKVEYIKWRRLFKATALCQRKC